MKKIKCFESHSQDWEELFFKIYDLFSEIEDSDFVMRPPGKHGEKVEYEVGTSGNSTITHAFYDPKKDVFLGNKSIISDDEKNSNRKFFFKARVFLKRLTYNTVSNGSNFKNSSVSDLSGILNIANSIYKKISNQFDIVLDLNVDSMKDDNYNYVDIYYIKK